MGAKSPGAKHPGRYIMCLLFCRCGRKKRYLAAGLFDLLDGRLGSACNFERDLSLELAIGQNANAVLRATDDAGSLQSSRIDRCLRVQLAGIDGSLDACERYDDIVGCEDVGEATLRQATVEGHLTAFEAFNGNTRTGLLTLYTTTTGLAGARANTAAEALAA